MKKKNQKKKRIRTNKPAPAVETSTTAEDLLENRITPKLNESGQLESLSGNMEICGILLRFSIKRQSPDRMYPYRGTISVIDPATGQIMMAYGNEKKRRNQELEKKRAKRNAANLGNSAIDNDSPSTAASGEVNEQEMPLDTDKADKEENNGKSNSDRALLLRKQVYFRSKIQVADAPFADIRKELAEFLLDQGKQLYLDHRSMLYNSLQDSITPETITPLFAMMLYFDPFVSETRPNMSNNDKTKDNCRKELEQVLSKLPVQSMGSFIQRDFRHNERFEKLSGTKKKMLYDFWQYCIAKCYCKTENNPIPLQGKRKKTGAEMRERARTPGRLDHKQIKKLYQYCLEVADGLACGLCLLLNGYKEDFIRKLTWKDVVFKERLVLILNYQGDRVSATKDYTRPCNRLLAELLRKRYQALLRKYKEKTVLDMPIVSSTKSDMEGMDNKDFVAKCTSVLKNWVEPSIFQKNSKNKKEAVVKRLLRNTYESLVKRDMGIEDDEGTMQFLLEERLESTTDESYASYTSPEASERLFAIQNRCLPAFPLDQEKKTEDLGNGMVRVTLYPKTTSETLTLNMAEDFLPNAQIKVSARHGASAFVKVRELKEDGTPKRASRKKQSN